MGPAGAGRQLFVYWRLDRAHLPAAAEAARVWQQRLMADEARLTARLLVRADDTDADATLMEIYTVDSAGVGALLQARIEHEGGDLFARWQRGPRHVEVFAPCPG